MGVQLDPGIEGQCLLNTIRLVLGPYFNVILPSSCFPTVASITLTCTGLNSVSIPVDWCLSSLWSCCSFISILPDGTKQ